MAVNKGWYFTKEDFVVFVDEKIMEDEEVPCHVVGLDSLILFDEHGKAIIDDKNLGLSERSLDLDLTTKNNLNIDLLRKRQFQSINFSVLEKKLKNERDQTIQLMFEGWYYQLQFIDNYKFVFMLGKQTYHLNREYCFVSSKNVETVFKEAFDEKLPLPAGMHALNWK
jgi:hypothetical protein